MLIATAMAAFGVRWWLTHDTATGDYCIVRERTPGGSTRSMRFRTEPEARGYFETYTTPIVGIEQY